MIDVLIRRCHDCRRASRLEDEFCVLCGGQTESEPAAGRGLVYSWTTVVRSLGESTDTPYTILSVDLDEHVRVLGRLCVSSTDLPLVAGASVVPCAHSRTERLEFTIESS